MAEYVWSLITVYHNTSYHACTVHNERKVDPFKVLAEETALYQNQGMIYYAGDFNSRVGELKEEWETNDPATKNSALENIDSYGNDNISSRLNQDKSINNFGKKTYKIVRKFRVGDIEWPKNWR